MKQILVVDNHPVVRKFMYDLIVKRGHEVSTAEDGVSALHLLKSCTPDLIFVDLVMPNINGKTLCKLIRRNTALHRCFIVVLSGITVEEGEKRSPDDLWADLLLAKGPFDRLAWQVDYIIRHLETGRMDRLKGEVIGARNLFSRQIVKELMSSKSHFELTLNNMSEGLMELTSNAEITYLNPAALSIIGKSEETLLAEDFVRIFNNEDQARIRQKISEADGIGKEPILDEILMLANKQVLVKIIAYSNEDHRFTLVVILTDITKQKQLERDLIKEKEQYRLERNFLDNVFENSADAIVIVDEHGRFIRGNSNAAKMFGYSIEEMKGRKAFDLYTDRHEMKEMLTLLRKQEYVQNYQINFTRKDGSSIPCAVSISLLYSENNEKIGSLSIIRDLSEWKLVEESLKYLSFHDSLTGVYNRAFFEEEMERLAKGRHLPLGLIICDIDGLKLINDTFGHQKGDEFIKEAAEIFKRSFRSSDIIARIGGDEFAVLLPDSSAEVIKDCIRRIRKEIESYNAQAMGQESLSISIGYAIGSQFPLDLRSLFKEADDNMYREKAQKH